MDEVPSYVARLLTEQRLSGSGLGARARAQLRPLFDGGALTTEPAGRGEIVRVANPDSLRAWVRQNYPAYAAHWTSPEPAARARAVALRRDSKVTGAGVGSSVLHLRAIDPRSHVTLNASELPAVGLTERHGLAACLIDPHSILAIQGATALVENLECFLHAEMILPKIAVLLNTAGRISDQLIGCLSRARIDPHPILHLPDYDPVGLSDYLRLRSALGSGVALYVPDDLETRFVALGNRKLIANKPRNRTLLEQLGATAWPCQESAKVFSLIRETGSGLEQESLFLQTHP